MKIDVDVDFTLDTPNYWNHFWDGNGSLGVGGGDPDSLSKSLQLYHQSIWSRKLPCGDTMVLQCGSGPNYLTWKDFRFGSDSIIVSFRHEKYRHMLDEVQKVVPDYKTFVEDYLHKAYTIGGTIIFPKHAGSINQAKGTNPKLRDRWDLTLECIRRYYCKKESPISKTLARDKDFFDLFIDFKGYVDYFFLQDCVSTDYSSVEIWIGNAEFTDDPLPKTVDEYLLWINRQMDFLEKRNKRIAAAFKR
ncbi:MAG: hypothetical protein IJS65_06250 [Clostridia bacterium]|nr:hypothetical protein [Clostridia bacterium]